MFFSNTDSLGYQSFKGTSWALVLGLPLRDTIKGILLVLCPFLIPKFGLVSWASAPIILNSINFHVNMIKKKSLYVYFADVSNLDRFRIKKIATFLASWIVHAWRQPLLDIC